MRRKFLKEARGAFPTSVDEYVQPVERLLHQRRAEADAAWKGLKEGWEANGERMVALKVRPRPYEENVVNLNIGGSNVTLFWHLLAEIEGFEDTILGAFLEGVWGKGRIPRDTGGCIVIDESPSCMKHIIAQTMLRAKDRVGSVAVGLPESAARSAVAVDEAPCLVNIAYVMGLSGYLPTIPKYPIMNGGNTTTLEPFEIAPLGAKVREWVDGSADEMTLIYRATRDGFGRETFLARCNVDSPKTVSLIRVSPGKGDDDGDSVVGGYSVRPWDRAMGCWDQVSKGEVLFMLKNGSATQTDPSKPTKWYTPHDQNFVVPRSDGPHFCVGDMIASLRMESGNCTINTKRIEHRTVTGAVPPFVALNGQKVVDIEVYRCSTPAPPTTTAPSTTNPGGDAVTGTEAHDIGLFGKSIANSLMEERVVLDRAVKEMEAAGARVSAAAGALEAVYGPSVAAGVEDTVVELSVRGTRITTLLSTLQACSRSALATMFDGERWPATDKDKDDHGRRLIDCDPICFAKILDVLRMRKRASWSRGVTGGKGEECRRVLPGAVLIREADVEAFGVAVNMYFPGCESFIMDLVQPV